MSVVCVFLLKKPKDLTILARDSETVLNSLFLH